MKHCLHTLVRRGTNDVLKELQGVRDHVSGQFVRVNDVMCSQCVARGE